MRTSGMSERETKLENLLACLEEIEELQTRLRRIVPRKATHKIVCKPSIERMSNDCPHFDANLELENTPKSTSNEHFQLTEQQVKAIELVNVCAQTEEQGNIRHLSVFNDFRVEDNEIEAVKILKKAPDFQEFHHNDHANYKSSDNPIAVNCESAKATKENVNVNFKAFDFVDYFSKPLEDTSVNEACLLKFASDDNEHKNIDSVGNTNERIACFANAAVQTQIRQEIADEPFDILNYFHLPVSRINPLNSENSIGIASELNERGKSWNQRRIQPPGILKNFGPSNIFINKKKSKESQQHRNIQTVAFAPFRDIDFIGFNKPKEAAAIAVGTPARSAKQRQQVHESLKKQASKKNEVVLGHEERSQGTCGDRGEEAVRVPELKTHRVSKIMTERARPIGRQARVVQKTRDCGGNKLNKKQKEITRQPQGSMQVDQGKIIGLVRRRKRSGLPRKASDCEEMKEKPEALDSLLRGAEKHMQHKNRRVLTDCKRFVASKMRLGSRETGNKMNESSEDLSDHFEPIMKMRMNKAEKCVYRKRKLKKFEWKSLIRNLSCIGNRSKRPRVVVPDYYPGNKMPYLVDSEKIGVLDSRIETLKIIASAAKVRIGSSHENY